MELYAFIISDVTEISYKEIFYLYITKNILPIYGNEFNMQMKLF